MKYSDIEDTPEKILNDTNLFLGLEWKDWLYRFLYNWKWFLISVLFCLGIAWFYIYKTVPVYQTTETILLQDNDASSDFLEMEKLGFTRKNSAVEGDILTLTSPDLMLQVVEELGLNITCFINSRVKLRTVELYGNLPYKVSMPKVAFMETPNIHLKLTQDPKGFTTLMVMQGDAVVQTEKIALFPAVVMTPEGEILIEKNEHFEVEEQEVNIYINNPYKIASRLAKKILVSRVNKDSEKLLLLSMQSELPKRSKDILTAIVGVYNQKMAYDKGEVARNTAAFIDERLNNLAGELGLVEDKVVDFQRENKFVGNSSLGEQDITSGVEKGIDEERLTLSNRFILLEYVEKFFQNPENKMKLIPNLEMGNSTLASAISEYNKVLLERERIAKATTGNNPILQQVDLQLETLRDAVNLSILAARRMLNLEQDKLKHQENKIDNLLKKTPEVERKFLEIKRQQGVKEALYIFLLQKREEATLSLAATSSKAKIIRKAETNPVPIHPKKTTVYMISVILGFGIVVVAVILKEIFRIHIESREELERLGKAPVLGEIPSFPDHNPIVVKANDISPEMEMFRAFRNNVIFLLGNDKKVVLVSSTQPKEGKTFIAINLALSFSIMGKKTLLVGADIRNPQLSAALNLPKSQAGMVAYLANLTDDWRKSVEKSSENPNLFYLQAGIMPPNPNELLAKPELDQLFKEIREEYDIIVVDTAPLGPVSDTLLVQRIADIFLYVVREHVTPKASLEFVNRLIEEKTLKAPYFVLNDVQLFNAKYKYNYSYRYGYKYGYRYSSHYTSSNS